MAKRVRPLTTLLKKNVRVEFTDAMKSAVRQLLPELATPPVLVYPEWDAVSDGSRPFACIVTRAAMGLVTLLLNKSNLMVLSDLSFS